MPSITIASDEGGLWEEGNRDRGGKESDLGNGMVPRPRRGGVSSAILAFVSKNNEE